MCVYQTARKDNTAATVIAVRRVTTFLGASSDGVQCEFTFTLDNTLLSLFRGREDGAVKLQRRRSDPRLLFAKFVPLGGIRKLCV